MHDLARDQIVGDRQQRADEDAIAFLALGEPGVAVERHVGQRLGIETAFRAGGHDDGVLDALRLHQPENFGAEVVAAIGPAQRSEGRGVGKEWVSTCNYRWSRDHKKKKNTKEK